MTLGGSTSYLRSPLALLVLIGLALAGPAIASAQETLPGEVIVRFSPGGSPADREAAAGDVRARIVEYEPALGAARLALPARVGANEAARSLRASKGVQSAEPNYVAQVTEVPNDTYYWRQWALPKMSLPAAWDLERGSVTVAVIDTGVAPNHPDLDSKILSGYNSITETADTRDDQGHGTLVAGVVAAETNNALGIAGISRGSNILPVKAMSSSGSGNHYDIAQGIVWAAERGARVINMSLGGSQGSSVLASAISYAVGRGVVIAAAAGNSGAGSVSYPAAYPSVIAVGATDQYDRRASWSNYGSALDVTAPGVNVLTTWWSLTAIGYSWASGTSLATPQVSGVAVLILSRNPGLSPAAAQQILQAGAVDLGAPGWDVYYGYGRIDALRSLQLTGGGPTDTTPPSVAITSPSDGSSASGIVQVMAAAADNVGVQRVEFYVDGSLVGTDNLGPYTFNWDTTRWVNGGHTLAAKAYDAAGNVGSSASVTVSVSNSSGRTIVFTGSVSSFGQSVAWHSVSAAAAGLIAATLDWDTSADVDLYLFSASGALVAWSNSSAKPKTIVYNASSAGAYWLAVHAASGSANYVLAVLHP